MVLLAWPAAPDALLVDDAWYYLRTAQNLVDGYGVSFDRLEAFNGFHPLWLLTLLPLAAMKLGPDALARAVLLLQLGLTVAGLSLWGRAFRASQAGCALGAVVLLNPWAAKILMCGQESALAFALTGGLVVVLREERRAWEAGVLAGLCVLARLDSGVWMAVLLLAGMSRRPGALLAAAGIAGAVIVPWLGWSQWHFETVVPVSAAIKAEMASHASPWRWVEGLSAGVALSLGVLWFARRPVDRLGVAVVIGAALEATRLVALQPTNGVSLWYLWPLLPTVLLAGISFPASARLRLAVLGLWLAAAGLSWIIRLDPTSYAVATASRELGGWIAQHTPATARVAGWDIGATAAWSNRPFRNLEGLAASWRFKREVLDSGQLAAFLASGEVQFVAQYFSTGPLERQLAAAGLNPNHWKVVWSREVEMHSITSLRAPWRFTFVVLAFSPESLPEELPNESARGRVLPEGERPGLGVPQKREEPSPDFGPR